MPLQNNRTKKSARSRGRAAYGNGDLPRTASCVKISFVDTNDKTVWWPAVVKRMYILPGRTGLLAVGTVVYPAAFGHEENEADVHLFQKGKLCTVDKDGKGKGYRSWKKFGEAIPDDVRDVRDRILCYAISPSTDSPPATADEVVPDQDRSAPAPASSPSSSGNPTRSMAMLMNGTGPGPVAVAVDGEDGHVGNPALAIHERVAALEAHVDVLHKDRPLAWIASTMKETRVAAKIGILEEMTKQPKRVLHEDGRTGLDGVLQTGYITWATPCTLSTFKDMARTVHMHFGKISPGRIAEHVVFSPTIPVIDGPAGLHDATIHFSSGFDLFTFLGIQYTMDMVKLTRTVWESDGTHVRMLGGLQRVTANPPHQDRTMRLFVGHSCKDLCVKNATGTPATDAQDELPSSVLSIDECAWDSENHCLSTAPAVMQARTQFRGTRDADLTSFRITWETERPRSMRKVSGFSTDNEGVRRGRLSVQVPYVCFAAELAPSIIQSITDIDILNMIV